MTYPVRQVYDPPARHVCDLLCLWPTHAYDGHIEVLYYPGRLGEWPSLSIGYMSRLVRQSMASVEVLGMTIHDTAIGFF